MRWQVLPHVGCLSPGSETSAATCLRVSSSSAFGGGPTGYLRSVETNGMGLVWWLRQVGAYEVIHTSLLKPAKERQL